ncbi:MAG: exodeoxyribonuclease VII small subunit [Clostridia bacterium]|nr:exodeoxyribonuclease VII small subunit [Clostridia bacterium]
MENLSFEDAMKDLEEVVSELESGDLSLDKSIEKFKKGMELSNYCNKLLEDAEKTVSILVEQSDGSMKEENFITE